MAEAGNELRPSCDDPTSAAGRMYESVMNPDDLPHDIETTYVSRKEDMTYEELCTLEGMIALFNHDKSLDDEIANLKEDTLLTTIKHLEHDLKEANRCKDAMMILTYINPADIPYGKWNSILESAMLKPDLLLNYVDEDVELSWPIPKSIDMINESIMNGNYITTINHGLRTKDAADKEDA